MKLWPRRRELTEISRRNRCRWDCWRPVSFGSDRRIAPRSSFAKWVTRRHRSGAARGITCSAMKSMPLPRQKPAERDDRGESREVERSGWGSGRFPTVGLTGG